MTPKLIYAMLLSIGLHAATPTLADLATALQAARAAWGIDVTDTITFKLDPLNSCPLRDTHIIAMLTWSDVTTTLTTTDDYGNESAPAVTTHQRQYIIQINSACDWSKLPLNQTVIHEYGHILLGSEYHNPDKHSVMHYTVNQSQVITKEDRQLLATKGL